MRRHLFRTIGCSLFALFLASGASAVGTRTFELRSLDQLSGGELEGTSIDSRGRIHAGFRLGSLPLDQASSVFAALPLADGSVLLGTGSEGRILRVASGRVGTFVETGQIAVTSLAHAFGDTIVAGTLPEGRILRIDRNGNASTLADLPGAEGIWALAYDRRNDALFAATGPEGKIFRIDAQGQAQVYFDSDEPHIVSLALAGDGTLYAGSSGNALLYRLTGPGRASVVMDFPGNDVKALALGSDGSLYAISNEYAEPPDVPKRSPSTASPVNLARPKPGKGTLTRIDPQGRPERLLYRTDTHFVSLALDENDLPHVGTGVEGRIYAVDDALTTMLVADTRERQVGAMVLTGRSRFVATSDPPVFHEILGYGGSEAVWTSRVLDAGLRAHFGKIRWHATGPVEISTRTGNTEAPDKTWSDWSAPLSAPGQIKSPSARYIQVRARFARDPNATISEITLPFVTDNLRAVVTSIEAKPKNAPSTPRSTTTLPSSGAEPPSPSTVLKLSWKVSNPDGDALRYRLAYKLEGQNVWRDITTADEVVTKTEYDWETAGLPEGLYRVRVEASDERANPPDRTLRHALESGIVIVDNTPPVFRQLAVQGRRLRGEVVDGVGPIARIDISLDGRNWQPLHPDDLVFDEASESFDVDLSSWAGPGSHIAAVRAFDAAGNFVVRSVELR